MTDLLNIEALQISYHARGRVVPAVRDASLSVRAREAVGIAGESGCGKSTLARAVLGLMPAGIGRIVAGRITIVGQDVTSYGEQQWQRVRGNPVAIVFQDPLSFLNPVMTVGAQIAESVRLHDSLVPLRPRCLELLELVALPPDTLRRYPHELSGGMRQRVMLAIALGCRPQLLVADEPTTALDATTQAEIMALLGSLRTQLGMGLLIISHDLGLLRWHCDRVFVMYAGHTVEWGDTASVLNQPLHPYAQGLIAASRLRRGPTGRFGALRGDGPTEMDSGEGCPFARRCPHTMPICRQMMPPVSPPEGAHQARCWLQEPNHGAA
jgi:oligopeptide/dipeptide ABC transporter ATP-binding protein